VTLKLADLEHLLKQHSKKTVAELDSVVIDFTDELLKKELLKKPAIRYLRDRRESKRQ